MDGAFKLSFSKERLEFSAYPMREGTPNIAQRLHFDSYSLYKIKGSAVAWGGKNIFNLNGGAIGAQAGFTIITQLKELGAHVDDQTRSAEINFKKLLADRVAAVAFYTKEADRELKLKSDFYKKIEKIEPPLIEKNYYLVFSLDFYKNNNKQSRQIWKKIAKLRESAEFKRIVEQYN